MIICNMTTPPMLSSTFLAHYQQCVQPWKQQWLSWQLPAALPAALRNELVSQFHLEAQSERWNQQLPSNSNCHSTTSAKRKRKKRPLVSREESCWWKKFLTNEKRIFQLDMNTWEARLFRKTFRLPFDIFLKLYDMTISQERLHQSSVQGPWVAPPGCSLHSSNWCFPFVCVYSNWHLYRGTPKIFHSLDFKVCRKEGWICIHTERGRGRWWPSSTTTNSKWLQFHWASRLYRLSRLCAHWMESMSCLPEEYI